jgi:hypothetical protein
MVENWPPHSRDCAKATGPARGGPTAADSDREAAAAVRPPLPRKRARELPTIRRRPPPGLSRIAGAFAGRGARPRAAAALDAMGPSRAPAAPALAAKLLPAGNGPPRRPTELGAAAQRRRLCAYARMGEAQRSGGDASLRAAPAVRAAEALRESARKGGWAHERS